MRLVALVASVVLLSAGVASAEQFDATGSNLQIKLGALTIDDMVGRIEAATPPTSSVADFVTISGAVGSVVGLDRDAHALSRARERLEGRYPGRATYVHASYEDAPRAVASARRTDVDAALLDLGASSLQFDTPERGFSLQAAGPIDMRMDPDGDGPTAADLVNGSPAEELERIFKEYGDEPAAARIARVIVDERRRAPFRDTLRLAEAVARAVGGRRGKLHPATRVFQALRVAVNDEMSTMPLNIHTMATMRPPTVWGTRSP